MIPLWLWGILVGAGTALLGPPKAWDGVDPTNRHKGKPVEVGYHVWTAPRLRAWANDEGVCHITAFALVRRGEIRRLKVSGREKLLDNSWTWDEIVPEGNRLTVPLVFIHPVTREETHRELRFSCYPQKERSIWAR